MNKYLQFLNNNYFFEVNYEKIESKINNQTIKNETWKFSLLHNKIHRNSVCCQARNKVAWLRRLWL